MSDCFVCARYTTGLLNLGREGVDVHLCDYCSKEHEKFLHDLQQGKRILAECDDRHKLDDFDELYYIGDILKLCESCDNKRKSSSLDDIFK